MKCSASILAIVALCMTPAAAFTAVSSSHTASRPGSALSMAKNNEYGKTLAAGAVAASIFAGLFSAEAAVAVDTMGPSPDSFGSSTLVAGRSGGGRSGGRAGGRVSSGSMKSAPASTTTINRTTIVAPPVVAAPSYGYGYGGYGGGYYSPGGLGLSLGLNTVAAVGNGMREYRQTEQIAESRAELNAAREKEADMAERIRALERMQMQGGQQMPPQYYQQQQYAPPPMQYAAPPAPAAAQ